MSEYIWFTNQLIRIAQAHDATPLGYSLIECVDVPGGGAPLHTHPPAETFYVVEGVVEVRVWDESLKDFARIKLTTGQTSHVAPNVPHGYENIGSTKSKLLAVLTPGKSMEDFFRELGTPATDLNASPAPPDEATLQHIATTAQKYDILPWVDGA